MKLSLTTPADVQQQLAHALKRQRREMDLSRAELARLSTVPAPTLKRFETTGEISLRQFILLWHCVDDLDRLAALGSPAERPPRSIDEVLAQ